MRTLIILLLFISCAKEDVTTSTAAAVEGDLDTETAGVLSGSYGLSGTFTVDSEGISINSDYLGTSAPGPFFYLSNFEKSIDGGIRLGAQQKEAGAYRISTTRVSEFKYLISWCVPFSQYIGGGLIPRTD